MTVPPGAVGLAYKVAKRALSDGHYGQAAGREVMREALEAAAPRIIRAERERIIALAEHHNVKVDMGPMSAPVPFARLLRGDLP